MAATSELLIERLHRRPDARPLDDAVVAALCESIEQIGLVNPIRVRQSSNGYEVIAGAHRFAACDLIGHREITCVIVDDDDLHAELAMIDENLCRAELSPADRAKQTARRKAIYLELHPETDQGGNWQGGQFVQTDAPSFASETAKATGKDERTVRRDAERGERVVDAAIGIIRGTKLDTGTYLDKLKRLPPGEQVTTAKRDLAESERQRTDGRSGIQRRVEQTEPPASKVFERFIQLVDEIEALPIADLISSAGRQRAVLGQRASSLADRMSEIMEGLAR